MTENPELAACRLQAKELKKTLGVALGKSREDYWNSINDFLTGKISRGQFEVFVKSFLTQENIKTHNAYVLALIKCSILPTEVPVTLLKEEPSNTDSSKKRFRDSKEEKEFTSRQELKKIIRLMGKREREKLKSLPQETSVNFPSFDNTFLPLPSLTGQAAAAYSRGIQQPLCSESKLLPNYEYLRDRLNAIALEHGLSEGSDETAAEALLEGLETHMESLIKNCLFKVRLKTSCSELASFSDNTPFFTSRSTIDSRDLLTTFNISPYLLTERPNALEKLIIIHNPTLEPALSINRNNHEPSSSQPSLPSQTLSDLFSKPMFH